MCYAHAYVNEELIRREQAQVDIEDRGYQFGDGVYEVVGIYAGKPILLNEHLNRLFESAKKISLELSSDFQSIKEKILKLIALNNIKKGIVYFQFTRGVSPRDHVFLNLEIKPNFVAYTKNLDIPSNYYRDGVKVVLSNDLRWMRCDIKSLNLLPNVLSKQEAAENDSFEAILHRENTVTEGSSTNLFIIKAGIVYTHPANNYILNGITRQKVIELCHELNFSVIEKAFNIETLISADEVFITGTRIDVVPVVKIDNYNIGNSKTGNITKKLQKAFNLFITEEIQYAEFNNLT